MIYLSNRNQKYKLTNIIAHKSHKFSKASTRGKLLKKEYSPNTETRQIMASRNHKLRAIFSKDPEPINPLFFYKQKTYPRQTPKNTDNINLAYKGNCNL